MSDEREIEPSRPFGAALLDRERADLLGRVREEYAAITNRLWAGNGAGAIATITLLAGATKRGFPTPGWWLAAPTAFVLALVALSVGSAWRLLRLGGKARRLEPIDGVLEKPVTDIESGSQEAGLRWSDPRTLTGVIASVLLVVGVALGLAALFTAMRGVG